MSEVPLYNVRLIDSRVADLSIPASLILGAPVWCARALLCSTINGCVPLIHPTFQLGEAWQHE